MKRIAFVITVAALLAFYGANRQASRAEGLPQVKPIVRRAPLCCRRWARPLLNRPAVFRVTTIPCLRWPWRLRGRVV